MTSTLSNPSHPITPRPLSALCLLCALALSGCATTAPTPTPQARSHYDSSAQALAKSGAALLVDACSYRLEIGTSHVYPQRSDEHARLVQRIYADHLRSRGLNLSSAASPLLCTTFESGKFLELQQASAPGAPLQPTTRYPLRGSESPLTPEQETLVLQLWQAIHKLPATADKAPDTLVQPQPQPLALTPEQGKALSSLLGARYVWLIDAQVQDVSMGRAVGMVALTSALTLGLTGGAHSSWSTNEDGIAEATTLVDLEQTAVLWRRKASVVARNLVDFERPLADAKAVAQVAHQAFTPFYEAPGAAPTTAPAAAAPSAELTTQPTTQPQKP